MLGLLAPALAASDDVEALLPPAAKRALLEELLRGRIRGALKHNGPILPVPKPHCFHHGLA